MNCGSAVSEGCSTATFYVDRTSYGYMCADLDTKVAQNDCVVYRFADLVAELVYVAQFLIIFSLTTMSS